MDKETILKSVHIAFDDAGKATVQLQHLERVSFEGELIRETYLPHERHSLTRATPELKKRLKSLLGEALLTQATQLQGVQAELDTTRHEYNTLSGLYDASQQQLELAQSALRNSDEARGNLAIYVTQLEAELAKHRTVAEAARANT